MELIDTHAHLNDNRFAHDVSEVIDRARQAGVKAIINVGYDLVSSGEAVSMASTYDFLFAAVGIHPHEASQVNEEAYQELERLAAGKHVVAIGEIGLDYYYNHSPHHVQQDVFRKQINLAKHLSLPVIIHDRDAHDDVLVILQEEGAREIGGVMHCFSGDTELARHCLDLGFYISLAGPVTFKNSQALAEVARFVPDDRLLFETDAPYLAPVPYRGRRNEPAYVRSVAEKVAELRGATVDNLSEQVLENAKRLFKWNFRKF